MQEPASVEKITSLKVPPHSVEAEQAVLGALMIDNSRWDSVHEVLLASDFYRREHRLIYEAMVQQATASKPIDVITLSEALHDSSQLNDAGGLEYLGELVNNTQSASNVVAYAGIVKERAILRKLISVAHGIADSGYNPDGRASAELLDAAEQAVYRIADERPRDGGPVAVNPILKSAVERIEKLFDAKGSITGTSTGFKDLDEMTSGLQKSDLVIVAGRPSMGKCIVAGSRLTDPDSGQRVTIDEIVRSKRGRLHSLDNDWKLRAKSPSAFVDDGIKPTFRVTTALGREIETTLSHPFLTETGWQPLANIEPGVRIGVPRELPVFGNTPMPEHKVMLLAYLIADRGLTHTCPTFTNTNPRLLDEFAACVDAFGAVHASRANNDHRAPTLRVSTRHTAIASNRSVFAAALRSRLNDLHLSGRALAAMLNVVPATVSYWCQGINVPQGNMLRAMSGALALPIEQLLGAGETSASRNTHNPLTAWLEQHGLWGKLAIAKRIPSAVFSLPRPQLALFLNRLFACDGSAYLQNGQQGLLSYASASRELARDVQHLLLRFGVLARFRHRQINYKNGYRDAWELVISHQGSLQRFIDEIGIFGKEEALARVRAALDGNHEHSNTDSLPEAACDHVLALKGEASWPAIFARKGLVCPPGFNPHLSGDSRRPLSRTRARFFAELFNDSYLAQLADSDLYWDTIVSIDATGLKQVYDLTVPDTHNFVAEDVLVHNTSFAMNMVEHAILHQEKPVLVFSLEMPADSLIIRMLSSLGKIDQTRMRNGKLENDDWDKLGMAVAKLRNRPLFIDDTSGLSPSEMRARARRVAREHGDIGMIMVDYLQLMQVKGSSENRTGEISEISRSLKLMAREFNCPVVALSQLNRSLEQRPNKRPVMSDLRECVTGATLVTLASGARVPIAQLVGATPEVLAIDANFKIVKAQAELVWSTGIKPVFRVHLASGRTLDATANHRVLTGTGWATVEQLGPGSRMAVARCIPEPAAPEKMRAEELILLGHMIGDGSYLSGQPLRYTTSSEDNSRVVAESANAAFRVAVNRHEGKRWHQLVFSGNGNRWHPAGMNAWLRELGIFNQPSHQKRVPDKIFLLANTQIALFLKHLWSADGTIHVRKGRGSHVIHYATNSLGLAHDVMALLTRLGIITRLQKVQKGSYKPGYMVKIYGCDMQRRFIEQVGAFGPRTAQAAALLDVLPRVANTNADTLPQEIFASVTAAMKTRGISQRMMAIQRGTSYGGSSHFSFAPSREMLAGYAELLDDDELRQHSASDIFWDRVVLVEALGEQEVFDLTVPGPASWLADCVVSHNSGAIEQDADIIMFVYRHEVYEPDNDQFKGIAEIIIGKQRNGPIGTKTLSFIGKFTRFENYTPMSGGAPPPWQGE